MKLLQGILLLTAGIWLTSCEKVINVDLKTASPKLVIDASINWLKNTPGNEQRVKLSTTTSYYSEKFPTVSGATIFITNPAGRNFNFPESATTGEYVCTDFVPVIGATYTLTVRLNGITYTAVETLTATPDIDNVIKQNDKGGMTGDEIEIEYYFQDTPGEDNYYMAEANTNRVAYPVFDLESDQDFQGKKMTQYFSHEDLAKGDAVNLKLYGVSKRFFEYFRKILSAAGGDTGPFPTTPTAVRGNIINQADANDYILGYFRLAEVVARDYTIQ